MMIFPRRRDPIGANVTRCYGQGLAKVRVVWL